MVNKCNYEAHLVLLRADVEFLWWWWGLHSHFRIQPNYSVVIEVVLCCVVVGVMAFKSVEDLSMTF